MAVTQDDCAFCQLVADPQADATWIADFDHTVAFVNRNQMYRGSAILITRAHHEDLLAIGDDEFAAIARDLRALAGAVQQAFRPERINYANLGNVMAHQHWHIIPRTEGDASWGKAPLFDAEPVELSDAMQSAVVGQIRLAL